MRKSLFAVVLTAVPLVSFAQSDALSQAQAAPIIDEAPVVVTGVQPGPGMWKVHKGDHTMWVLATQTPLPKKMEWVSRDVQAVLGQADEIIWTPGFVADADIGFFGKLALVPSLLGIRKNPDGRTLQEVVPADMYARWATLKRKYLGRDGDVEKWRPMFAAMELYQEAVDKSGMTFRGVVSPVVSEVAKARGIPITTPRVTVKIEEPRAAIKEFRKGALDDVACFDATLRRLETDLEAMAVRANAWAVGDVDTLRSLPVHDQNRTCMAAAMRTSVMRRHGADNFEARIEQAWLDAADKALAKNRVTFAMLSMQDVLRPDGMIAKLQAKGYEVEAP